MTDKYHDHTYIQLLQHILQNGAQKGDRTGTGTISVFGYQMRFDLSEGSIPLLTTKKMHTKSIIHEILWYLQGGTNVQYLQDNGVRIWNEWADENGDLGPVYGKQWRDWTTYTYHDTDVESGKTLYEKWDSIDQIAEAIDKLRNNPNDRRIIVSAWNVGELRQMRLPPCHLLFQFYSVNNRLSCQMYQRSCDAFLGIPFNIVQYSILTHMMAQVTGHEAAEFIWTGGDVHLYLNHLDQARLQVTRTPYPSPRLELNPGVKEIDDFRFDDFAIKDYNSHPTIKATVSV